MLESARYLSADIRSTLDLANYEGYLVPESELDWMRDKLEWIASYLRAGLDIVDQGRIPAVLANVDSLIETIESYREAR